MTKMSAPIPNVDNEDDSYFKTIRQPVDLIETKDPSDDKRKQWVASHYVLI